MAMFKIWVRQLGWWHSQYMESHKIHVPNHQPDNHQPTRVDRSHHETECHLQNIPIDILRSFRSFQTSPVPQHRPQRESFCQKTHRPGTGRTRNRISAFADDLCWGGTAWFHPKMGAGIALNMAWKSPKCRTKLEVMIELGDFNRCSPTQLRLRHLMGIDHQQTTLMYPVSQIT